MNAHNCDSPKPRLAGSSKGCHAVRMSILIAVDSQGHLILPEPLREKIGVSGGGAVVAEETPDGILLRKTTELYSPEQVQEFDEMNERALEPKRPFLERFKLE